MGHFLRKYGAATTIRIPVVKRAVVDFAVGADWTPAAGDVKITKDGGAAANVTNLPTALTMGNTALWLFSLTATEMQAAEVVVTVADSATKAVEDQSFIIETYGNASAQHEFDIDTQFPTVDVWVWRGTAAPVEHTGGYPIVTVKDGTGTGEIDTASGRVAITEAQIDQIVDEVLDEDMTGHQTQGTLGQAIGDPVADTNTIYKAVVTDATGATVGVDVVAVKAETASIQTDTNDIQARLPAALTADGNIKADTLRVGGTLQTAGDIIGDTNDIQARLPAALTAGGNMKSDMLALNGGTQSAADLKDFADDGYDPATNKVQGVVLTDTVTTYTGNTVQTGDSFARLGAPAGASVSADIADVEGKVDDLETRLGTPSDLGSGATVAANLVDIEGQTDNLPGIETKIDDIKAKTDNLPSDPADQSLIIAATTAIVADTEDIQARLPAALVGGRMDSSVGAMANGTVTAAVVATGAIDADALAADAANEIRDAVFARAFSAAYGSHTFDELVKMIAVALLGKVSGMDTNAPVFRNIADNADVIVATTDADGNRSAVTLTP